MIIKQEEIRQWFSRLLHRKDFPHRWIWQPIRWKDVREKLEEVCKEYYMTTREEIEEE